MKSLMARLIAFDIAVNAILLGRKVQSVSKRAAQARAKGRRWGCIVCRVLEMFERGHCDLALIDARQGE